MKIFRKIKFFLKTKLAYTVFNSPFRLNNSGNGNSIKNIFRILFVNDARKLLNRDDLSSEKFSEIVSSIRIGKAWKSTKPFRHTNPDKVILENISTNNIVVLDIGVSDGRTSFELINKLDDSFISYYVTDICLNVDVLEQNGNTCFFYPKTKKCFMIVSNRFAYYRDLRSLIFPLNWIVILKFANCPKYDENKVKKLSLLNPVIHQLSKENKNVKIAEWDMFDPWEYEKADLIKTANVLNKVYFKEEKIREGLNNIRKILKDGGFFILVENRKINRWSLFKKDKSVFKLIKNGNGGSEIEKLVMNMENN